MESTLVRLPWSSACRPLQSLATGISMSQCGHLPSFLVGGRVAVKGLVGASRVCLLSNGCRGKQSFVYERNSFRYADSISAAVTSTASFTLKDRFMRARSRRNEGAPEPL